MNKDEMNDDAEFEAFLKGEGDLARRLQGLAQPSPGPALDAAILGRIRTSMEQQRDSAANDAGEPQSGPRVAPVMGMRWRVPVGIAASVLVGLLATQAYQSNTSSELVTMRDQERAADAVLREEAAPPAAAAQAPAPSVPSAQVAALEPAPQVAPPAERAAAELEKRSAASAPKRRSENVAAAPAAPPPPAMVEAYRPASPAPAMPAPAGAAPASAGLTASAASPKPAADTQAPLRSAMKASASAPLPQAMQEVTITGSRIPSRVAEGASPVQLLDERQPAASAARLGSGLAPDPRADAALWAQLIENMLDKGDISGALREWKKLRETYPDFAAPARLEARMKRLLELNG